MKISSPLHGAIKYIPSFVSWIGGWLVGLSVGSMVLHFLPFSFSCYVHFFTQDVNTHCVKIRCLNLCSQDVIQTKSPIPEPPLYLLEQKQKQKQVKCMIDRSESNINWCLNGRRTAQCFEIIWNCQKWNGKINLRTYWWSYERIDWRTDGAFLGSGPKGDDVL